MSWIHRINLPALVVLGLICVATPVLPAWGLEECRLLRQPDIQGDRVAFVYGGDLWTVARDGGVAARLTTHEGVERFPKFSPDGSTIAFTAEYDGNVDAFPYFFRLQGLGPVIGKRTWGGLIGISHFLPLIDGGVVTMPDFGMWDPKTGEWLIENHGTEPDIEVENAPDQMVAGRDPQLERAIEYVLGQIETNPPKRPARPAYKVRR